MSGFPRGGGGLPLGLPGATAPTRYVGGTTSGAPITGTFAVGDFVIDETGAIWICTVAGTPGTWAEIGSGSAGVSSFNTRTGAVVPGNADYLAVASGGLTGATAATRYVGGTTSGAPVSGTFAKGDFVIDETGAIWICTTAGTPGTWTQVGSSSGVSSFNTRTGAVVPGNADYLAVASGGLTGAVAATRYVGGTTSGAPVSGTFAKGDFVIDETGQVWICTTAGTPGTWTAVGATGNVVTSVFTRTGGVTAGNADYLAVATGGLTGATGATRYVGGTVSGAPASGTFAQGDFVVTLLGQIFICTTAGTPGTWTQVGAYLPQVPQVITTTGTWTPGTTGGQYFRATMVGGGGQGGNGAAATGGGGGGGGQVLNGINLGQVTSAQTVTIGAANGATSIGSIAAAQGGSNASTNKGGASGDGTPGSQGNNALNPNGAGFGSAGAFGGTSTTPGGNGGTGHGVAVLIGGTLYVLGTGGAGGGGVNEVGGSVNVGQSGGGFAGGGAVAAAGGGGASGGAVGSAGAGTTGGNGAAGQANAGQGGGGGGAGASTGTAGAGSTGIAIITQVA